MVQDPDRHKFNDDLLANDGDRRLAESSYPGLIHILDHPDLQQLFACYDTPANLAKKRSRRAGLLAIVLGTLALLGTSAEPLSDDLGVPSTILGMASAVAGILSVAIGLSGVLYANSKRRWLCQRLMTERLRQFHFQTFVRRLPDIVASRGKSGDVERYEKERCKWFDAFKARYTGHLDSEFTRIIDEDRASDMWLHELPPDPTVLQAALQADLTEVFAAYKALRINHQLQYANYKLRADGRLLSASSRMQEAILSQAAFVCVLALFAIHLWIAITLSVPWLKAFDAVVHNPWGHVVAIWCAIFALAIRAVEEGLGVRDETERYRDYRSSVDAIRKRFEQATDPAKKLRIMEEMERLSYEEMCSFLRNVYATRCVM
jgi:hypothetical protein